MAVLDRFRRKAEIELTAEFVRDLLWDQQPDLADRPLALGAVGWANQLWRLGDDLVVRLPWKAKTDASLLLEHAWLPVLAPFLPLAVPVPQRLGQPSARFPRPWIVTTWVPGAPAECAPVTRGTLAADALAAFVTALHRPAPPGVPEGRGRRGALTKVARGVAWQFKAMTDRCAAVAQIEQEQTPDPGAVRAIWDDAVAAPEWEGPPLWLHGDLHPANVLTADGNICGVVDFGDMCAGDPALDLAACWILLPDHEAIERFRAACPLAADDATWRRARGWAIWRACGSLDIATASHAGRKPSWGPPALASLQRLTDSVARRPVP